MWAHPDVEKLRTRTPEKESGAEEKKHGGDPEICPVCACSMSLSEAVVLGVCARCFDKRRKKESIVLYACVNCGIKCPPKPDGSPGKCKECCWDELGEAIHYDQDKLYSEGRAFRLREASNTAETCDNMDEGKPPIALLPLKQLNEVAQVVGYGARKYAKDNWKKGETYRSTLSAALRHLVAFQDGEDTCPESELGHLAHAVCNLLFLMWYKDNGEGTDDR